MKKTVYIENEGALFRGASRAWPSEVWKPKSGTWAPYVGETPKPIEWGDIIEEAEAKAMMTGPKGLSDAA